MAGTPPTRTHPARNASADEPASHRPDCGVGDDRAMEFLGGAIIIILVGLAIHFATQHETGKKPATKGDVRSVAAGVRSVAADLEGVMADLRSQRRDLSSAESDISDAESAIDKIRSDIADLRGDIADLRSQLTIIHLRLDGIE
jgi:septal ring factor EnvC (AmiA/AmiB activator)